MVKNKLLLARLHAAGEKGATESAVRKDLEPIWARAHERGGSLQLTSLLEDAVRSGIASREPKKTSLRLTSTGASVADQMFPDSKPRTFAKLKKTWLTVHALGLEQRIKASEVDHVSKVTTLRLVLINQHLNLGLPVIPNAKDFDRALAWHALRGGVTDAVHDWLQRQPLTVGTVLSALAATVGRVNPSPQKGAVYAKVAAGLVGAENADDLHAALLVRLVGASESPRPPISDAEFAKRVLSSSRRSPAGKLDDSLILINHAYSSYARENPDDPLSLDEFKRRLWSAVTRDNIKLAAADMPQTLNRDDLDASMITRGESHYALIRIQGED